jgi:signal transduction histidine kinase/ActR/RegA family two-component response regulator
MKENPHTNPEEPDFKTLFQFAPGLYLVLSPSLQIVAVSDAYLRATMTKREDIIGRGLFEVFPDNPDDPVATGVNNLHASLKRVLKKKESDAMAVQKYDIQRPASEGGGFEERYWSPLNSPVLDKDGNLQYIIHKVEDVTDFVSLKQRGIEQDKLTEDLKVKAEKMETEIYLRAQQLQTANEKLRESEQLKDQFLTNMSHEIRTPMNAIIGFADLLTKTKLDKKQEQFINAIRDSGQNLLGIINDILDFSKIQAGMLELENIPFSVPSLADSVHTLLESKASAKDVAFIINCESNIPEIVSGDPTRLTQIIVNLAGNAIKFTEKGFVKLNVLLKETTQNYCLIEFRIEDSGIGIAPESLHTVFERFTQANADTTRKYGGTGLGLSIVKKLVEVQGGKIEVASVLGKGSIFTVTIPFQKASTDQLSSRTIQPSIDDNKKMDGVQVLLAEDNKMNQLLAVEVLSKFGILTDVAENGRLAIDKCMQQDYDVILMDMQMAEMDGYQATLYIREQLKKDVPIIAMTAHAMAGEREKCLSLGMNDYISKPFHTAELYEKIKKVLPAKPILQPVEK